MSSCTVLFALDKCHALDTLAAVTYSLQAATQKIITDPPLPKAIIRRRFLHWVNLGIIKPTTLRGKGVGRRREYDVDAIRFAAVLFRLSHWMEGERLRRAGEFLHAHSEQLRKQKQTNVLAAAADGERWFARVYDDGQADFAKQEKGQPIADLYYSNPSDFLLVNVSAAVRSVGT